MNKYIIIILIASAALLLVLLVIGSKNINFPNLVKQKAGQQTQQTSIQEQETFPNYTKHPNYYNAVIVYTFVGDIDQISISDKEMSLKSSEPLPVFKLSDDVKVARSTVDGQTSPSSVNELQPGTKVSISAMYDLKSNAWTVPYITIIPSEQNSQPATPSSGINK